MITTIYIGPDVELKQYHQNLIFLPRARMRSKG